LIGIASTALATAVPDTVSDPEVAIEAFRDISAGRSTVLSAAQTSHETDRLIGSLAGRDLPSVGSLLKWMQRGPALLRVNSAGILAKAGLPAVDDDVVRTLKGDHEVRHLYLTAVAARLLRMPWKDAGHFVAGGRVLENASQLDALAAEACNPYDSGLVGAVC
jgi:hypothetical protein